MNGTIEDMRRAYEAQKYISDQLATRLTSLREYYAQLVKERDAAVAHVQDYNDLYSTLIDVLKDAGVAPQVDSDPISLAEYVIAAAELIHALRSAA